MFKKSFIFIFILFASLIFPNELSIFVTDTAGNPLSGAYITMDGSIRKTDANGFVQFSTNNTISTLMIEKTPYKSQQLALKLQEENNINIILQETYDFYVNIYEDSSFNSNFEDSSFSKTTVKEAMINIYKDNTLISSLDYYGKDLGFDLKKGEYTLVIYTLFSSPYVIENLKFDPTKSHCLNIGIPIQLYDVSGTITSKDTLLGGATISFKDKTREIKVQSNIEGQYTANLPSGFYNMSISKFGYETINKTIRIDGKQSDLQDAMTELPSLIKGRLVDSNGKGIQNQVIGIKNNGKELSVSTDSQGYYEATVFSGLAFVKINIPGFFPTGRVEKIDTLSTKIVPDLKLTERISSLSGTVTNGILPLYNVPIKLFDTSGTYFGMVKTDIKGFFSFPKIKSGVEYYLLIDDSNYTAFQSEKFVNQDNQNKNFTIILNNNDINFILELKSKTPVDYTGLSVYINNIKFQPDKNGIINETINSIKEIKTLSIEIPKLGIKNSYNLSELGSEPYLLTINF